MKDWRHHLRRAGRLLAAGAIWVWLAAASAWAADDLAPIPPFEALVTDLTATLSPEQKAGLERRLRDFQDRKGSQVAILLVPTTQPESIEQYSMRVAEAWKPGRKNVDDGVLFLVAKNDRRMRIEVGYGLEGVLTDATANRILDEIVAPRFQAGDFYGGIEQGADRIMRLIDGEPLPPQQRGTEGNDAEGIAPVLLIIALGAGGLLRRLLGRLPGATATGGIVGLVAWLLSGALAIALVGGALAFFFTLVGGGFAGLPGGYGGGHRGGRGGGFGGGFGGGGFGGGGGGGFGGGGASGRW